MLQEDMVLDITEPTELFRLVEQYQNSPNPLQCSNFGRPIYYKYCLSEKIDLLYKIGTLTGILASDETFDSSTYVNYKTQEVCDRVCRWIEENLWLKLPNINVYEPFIRDHQERPFLRVVTLQQIGLRAGLLNASFDEDRKLSTHEAKLVIAWVEENYSIKLRLPEPYLLDSEPIRDETPQKKSSNSYLAKIILPVLILGSIPVLFIQLGDKIMEHEFSKQQVSEDSNFLMQESFQRLEVAKKAHKLKESEKKLMQSQGSGN